MLRLSKIVKNYKETGALNENVSVYGFVDEHVFLTKAGDLGVVLEVEDGFWLVELVAAGVWF